jgi:hypothetical protein
MMPSPFGPAPPVKQWVVTVGFERTVERRRFCNLSFCFVVHVGRIEVSLDVSVIS